MQAFHLLTMLTQDSMELILREVEIIIMEKMHFMKDTPRVQASHLTCATYVWLYSVCMSPTDCLADQRTCWIECCRY